MCTFLRLHSQATAQHSFVPKFSPQKRGEGGGKWVEGENLVTSMGKLIDIHYQDKIAEKSCMYTKHFSTQKKKLLSFPMGVVSTYFLTKLRLCQRHCILTLQGLYLDNAIMFGARRSCSEVKIYLVDFCLMM